MLRNNNTKTGITNLNGKYQVVYFGSQTGSYDDVIREYDNLTDAKKHYDRFSDELWDSIKRIKTGVTP